MRIKKNNCLYYSAIGLLTKRGEKLKAKRILHNSIDILSKEYGIHSSNILLDISKKLSRAVEIRKLTVKKSTYFVPFPLKSSRRRFLFSKELYFGIKSNSERVSASNKLTDYMLSYLLKKGVNFNKKTETVAEILKYRSNTHYRW